MSAQRWHAGRLIYALAHRFDWRQNQMMTEFAVDGGQADLVFITAAGYLTEIEVKVSLADWRADFAKGKWQKPRPTVARFFYAIPETLAEKIPEGLPEHAGIIVVRSSSQGGPDYTREIKPARRLRAQKVAPEMRRRLVDNCYYRYWQQQMRGLGRRLLDDREKARAA